MKKFVVLLVVVAMTLISGVALAEVTVGGSYDVRMRNFRDLDFNSKVVDGQKDTQNRIRIDLNGKSANVKGKLQLESDFGNATASDWGHLEGYATSDDNGTLGFREAWVSFDLPGLPVSVTGGHQLLTIGNGWFFRSMHFGSDAWVVSNTSGNNTVALVNVKVAENNLAESDDADAYALIDVFKLNDSMTIGADVTNVKIRGGVTKTDLINLGVNFNGKLGPVGLKAQVDMQMGDRTNDVANGKDNSFAGNQIVIQGSLPVNPVTVNFTVASGSGTDAKNAPTATNGKDIEAFTNFMDVDPHYTFIYEYKIQPFGRGFANTTAVGVGATFAATKSVTVAADVWMLQTTEDVNNTITTTNTTDTTSDIGTEIDVKVNWKLYDNLSWNWTFGILKPGDALGGKGDDAIGAQGLLAYKF